MCLICFVSALALSAIDKYGEKRCFIEATSSSSRTVCQNAIAFQTFSPNHLKTLYCISILLITDCLTNAITDGFDVQLKA